MRTSRTTLTASVLIAVPLALLTAACHGPAPVAGAAYGATVAATATPTPSPTRTPTPNGTATATGAPMISAKATLTVEKTKIGYVLANGTGLTLYWYSHDVKNSGKSTCTGSCLTSWPAFTGMPVAAAGVKLSGKLGTITRPGGIVQATYNGYPLYRFSGDVSPGQTQGNGVGGVWHVVTGAALSSSPAAAAAASARDLKSGSS